MTESDYQTAILELLELLGYRARPLRTRHGWKTGLQGAGSTGWPDVIACRGSRLLAIELKSAKGILSDDQKTWLRLLAGAGVECFVFREGTDSLQSVADILTTGVGGAVSVEAER